MILIRLLRLLFGYTRFKVTGGFAERFFAICEEKKIGLSEVQYIDGGISAFVYSGNIEKIPDCASQAGMNFEIIKKHGLPQLLHRYRLRLGIPVGLLIAFLLFSFWSSIIWSVNVSGNERVPTEKILALTEENGLKRGVFASTVDCDTFEDTLMSAVSEFSWVSLNIKGCRAEIEVTEMLEVPEIIDKNRYVNIVASHDGEILSADVLAGTGNIKVGFPVQKGDLLVNGVITLKNGGVRFVHSQAKIIARTKYKTESAQTLAYRCMSLNNEKNIYSVYLFGLKIPFGYTKNKTVAYECEYALSAGKTVFPVSLVRTNTAVKGEKTVELTVTQAKLLCAAKYPLCEAEQFDAIELETRAVKFENTQKEIKMTGNSYCNEDIASEQLFEVEISQ